MNYTGHVNPGHIGPPKGTFAQISASGSNNCGVLMGAHGSLCDSPLNALSWTRLKALYR